MSRHEHPAEGENAKNYELFRDSLSAVLIEKLSRPSGKPRRRQRKASEKTGGDNAEDPAPTSNDADAAEDLAEFIDYIASETFTSLPSDLQSLTHYTWDSAPSLRERYAGPFTGADVPDLLPSLDPSIADSLSAYGIATAAQGVPELLAPVVGAYVSAATTPPPPPITTKAAFDACELCGRDWINLTYHHLIPRFVHAKVVKRGWHRPDELQNVAWLCGACHRAVHRFASHEDLARHYYTVELLKQQDEIVRFAEWVGKLRWKGK